MYESLLLFKWFRLKNLGHVLMQLFWIYSSMTAEWPDMCVCYFRLRSSPEAKALNYHRHLPDQTKHVRASKACEENYRG